MFYHICLCVYLYLFNKYMEPPKKMFLNLIYYDLCVDIYLVAKLIFQCSCLHVYPSFCLTALLISILSSCSWRCGGTLPKKSKKKFIRSLNIHKCQRHTTHTQTYILLLLYEMFVKNIWCFKKLRFFRR